MIDKLLFKLLMLDGNGTNLLENQESYEYFKMLVLEIAKVKYSVRYCTNKGCPCHPETRILAILDVCPELYAFLEKERLKNDIVEIAMNLDEKGTIFDILGDDA